MTPTVEMLGTVFADVEFAVDKPSRTVSGRILPWSQIGRNSQGTWSFDAGSITWEATNPGVVKFIDSHVKVGLGSLLGNAVQISNRPDGLYATFAVAETPEGDRFLSLANSPTRILDGLSVGVALTDARQVEMSDDGTYLVHGGALLREVSAVIIPAFTDARITAVSAADDMQIVGPSPAFMEEIRMSTTTTESTATTDDDAQPIVVNASFDTATIADALAEGLKQQHEDFSAFLEKFGEQMERPTESPAPVASVKEHPVYSFAGGLGNYSMVRDLWDSKNHDDAKVREEAGARFAKFQGQVEAGDASFATGSTSNASQLMPTIARQDLYVPNLDYDTPLWDSVSKGRLDSANSFTIPKFGSSSGLSGDHTEGTNPTPGSLGFSTQTIQPSGISGSFKLTREIAMSSAPQLDQIALTEMFREYTEDREAKIAALLNGLSNYGATGSLTGDGAALIDALKTQLVSARFRRGGNRLNRIAAEQDAYQGLATAKDDVNRPLLPGLAPSNADGTVQAGLEGLNLAGYPVLPAYALAAATYLFAAQSVWAWASEIQRFTFEEKDGPANIELAHWSLFASAVTRNTDVVKFTYTPA